MAMEAMQAEDAMHGQDQAGMEDMGGPAPLTVLQVGWWTLCQAVVPQQWPEHAQRTPATSTTQCTGGHHHLFVALRPSICSCCRLTESQLQTSRS